MASIINASTAGTGGLISTTDASGIMHLQSDGTTKLIVDSTGAHYPGAVVQVVNFQTGTASGAQTGTIPIDNSIPQNTEGTEFMSLAITPKSASNLLLIDVVFPYYITTACSCVIAIFQDSTANALACAVQTIPSAWLATVSFRHKMTAGTTSSTTFKVRAGGDANVGAHTYMNGTVGGQLMGGVFAASITITEISA